MTQAFGLNAPARPDRNEVLMKKLAQDVANDKDVSPRLA